MRLVKILLGCMLTGCGALFAAAYYDCYWRWRDCFNDLGRCYDPVSQDVYLDSCGAASQLFFFSEASLWCSAAAAAIDSAARFDSPARAVATAHLLGWKTGMKTGIITATYGLWREASRRACG